MPSTIPGSSVKNTITANPITALFTLYMIAAPFFSLFFIQLLIYYSPHPPKGKEPVFRLLWALVILEDFFEMFDGFVSNPASLARRFQQLLAFLQCLPRLAYFFEAHTNLSTPLHYGDLLL